MAEIVYSTQRTGFDPTKVYRNPRYFERAMADGVSRVTVVGDWPSVVAAYKAAGVEVVSVTGPVLGNVVPKAVATAINAAFPEGIGTDSGDQFSDDELRKIIEQVTGEKVHHKTGREKLVARYNELNAKAAQETGN